MRGVIAVMLAGLGIAAADPPRDDTSAQQLTAQELHKYFAPYVPAIRDCYVANAVGGTGVLRLQLVIQRDGFLQQFKLEAPGVTRQAMRALDVCLRPLSETWHFPVRRSFTTAVVPYFFVRSR